jgi:hypothetical protein
MTQAIPTAAQSISVIDISPLRDGSTPSDHELRGPNQWPELKALYASEPGAIGV